MRSLLTSLFSVRKPHASKLSNTSQRGLTLVEILIVLVIIGLVGGWLANKTFKAGDKAKRLMTEAQIKQVGQYLEQFQLRYNALPQNLKSLACEGSEVENCFPLAKLEELQDAWRNDFVYNLEEGGRKYRITSLGADGKQGGTDYDADLFGTGP